MKIYTGGGDRGKTSLFSGERISKGDARIDAYGDLDELNSFLGVVAAALPAGEDRRRAEIQGIQSHLFDAGAWLATVPGAPAAAALTPFPHRRIEALEGAIDALQGPLAPLAGFILPGGHPAAAWAHVARTVCRRLERRVVRLAEGSGRGSGSEPDPIADILIFINRLSDYLFVLARHINRVAGCPDVPWRRERGRD